MTTINPEKEYNSLNSTHNLFLLHTELIDNKVEVSVRRAIDPVVDQLVNLRQEVQRDFSDLRQEMTEVGVTVGARLSSVEHALGKRNQVRSEVRSRFMDYAFKASWLALCAVLTYVLLHLHLDIHL